MQHVNKAGESKLLPKCTLPLTGVSCIRKVVTELAVLDILPEGGFRLIERAPGVSIDFIIQSTSGKLFAEADVKEMDLN
jgi:3-oxoacid CoA-transferase subunit B